MDLRGGIGGASSSFGMLELLETGLSLEEASISGTLLMLVIDDVDEEDDELPDECELTMGGGLEGFPLAAALVFDEELPASLSCDEEDVNGTGVFRTSFGDVCGLCIFSPRVNVKLLLSACNDDSAKLKSLS